MCTWGPTIKRGFVEGIVRRVNDLNAEPDRGDRRLGRWLRAAAIGPYRAIGRTGRTPRRFSLSPVITSTTPESAHGPREIRRLGMHVLKNEHVVLKHDGASLVLAGVTDYSAHHFDPAQRSDPAAAFEWRTRRCRGKKYCLPTNPARRPPLPMQASMCRSQVTHMADSFWPWNLFVHFFSALQPAACID